MRTCDICGANAPRQDRTIASCSVEEATLYGERVTARLTIEAVVHPASWDGDWDLSDDADLCIAHRDAIKANVIDLSVRSLEELLGVAGND